MDIFFGDETMRKTIRENAAGFTQRMFSAAMFAAKAERIYLDVLDESAAEKAVVCQGVMSCR